MHPSAPSPPATPPVRFHATGAGWNPLFARLQEQHRASTTPADRDAWSAAYGVALAVALEWDTALDASLSAQRSRATTTLDRLLHSLPLPVVEAKRWLRTGIAQLDHGPWWEALEGNAEAQVRALLLEKGDHDSARLARHRLAWAWATGQGVVSAPLPDPSTFEAIGGGLRLMPRPTRAHPLTVLLSQWKFEEAEVLWRLAPPDNPRDRDQALAAVTLGMLALPVTARTRDSFDIPRHERDRHAAAWVTRLLAAGARSDRGLTFTTGKLHHGHWNQFSPAETLVTDPAVLDALHAAGWITAAHPQATSHTFTPRRTHRDQQTYTVSTDDLALMTAKAPGVYCSAPLSGTAQTTAAAAAWCKAWADHWWANHPPALAAPWHAGTRMDALMAHWKIHGQGTVGQAIATQVSAQWLPLLARQDAAAGNPWWERSPSVTTPWTVNEILLASVALRADASVIADVLATVPPAVLSPRAESAVIRQAARTVKWTCSFGTGGWVLMGPSAATRTLLTDWATKGSDSFQGLVQDVLARLDSAAATVTAAGANTGGQRPAQEACQAIADREHTHFDVWLSAALARHEHAAPHHALPVTRPKM